MKCKIGLAPCYQQITWPTRPLHLEQPLTGKTRVQELRQLLHSVDTSNVCRSWMYWTRVISIRKIVTVRMPYAIRVLDKQTGKKIDIQTDGQTDRQKNRTFTQAKKNYSFQLLHVRFIEKKSHESHLQNVESVILLIFKFSHFHWIPVLWLFGSENTWLSIYARARACVCVCLLSRTCCLSFGTTIAKFP